MNVQTKCGLFIISNIIGYKKEWSTDTCYNVDEPWKHYNKWKKLDTKENVSFGLYEIPQIGKSIETESSLVVVHIWGESWGEMRSDC